MLERRLLATTWSSLSVEPSKSFATLKKLCNDWPAVIVLVEGGPKNDSITRENEGNEGKRYAVVILSFLVVIDMKGRAENFPSEHG